MCETPLKAIVILAALLPIGLSLSLKRSDTGTVQRGGWLVPCFSFLLVFCLPLIFLGLTHPVLYNTRCLYIVNIKSAMPVRA